MAVVIYGNRLFGEVERVPGLFAVATVFWHVNYLPLFPRGSHVVLEGSSDESFHGQPLGMSAKSVLAGYLRGWSAAVAIFGAGLAGLGGTAFFIGHQGLAEAAIAFSVGIALAAGFWFVIASRSWLLAALVYFLLVGFSLAAVLAVYVAIRQNPALEQVKAKEIACFPGLIAAHAAALLATLSRVLNFCSYDRAVALAQILGIDPQHVAVRYGMIPPAHEQFHSGS